MPPPAIVKRNPKSTNTDGIKAQPSVILYFKTSVVSQREEVGTYTREPIREHTNTAMPTIANNAPIHTTFFLNLTSFPFTIFNSYYFIWFAITFPIIHTFSIKNLVLCVNCARVDSVLSKLRDCWDMKSLWRNWSIRERLNFNPTNQLRKADAEGE